MNFRAEQLSRQPLAAGYVHVYRSEHVILGFSEIGVTFTDLQGLFPAGMQKARQLKQTHSDIVKPVDVLTESEDIEGDGIILNCPGIAGVIRTADCTPLFIWSDDGSAAAVIHVGWRGLLKGIEIEALHEIKHFFPGVNMLQLNAFLGPAIEQNCYEVGEDVYRAFSGKHYHADIFRPGKKAGKFLLDVKKGMTLSLEQAGMSLPRIIDSGICTYCEPARFPSYRRLPGSGQRIYNFMLRIH